MAQKIYQHVSGETYSVEDYEILEVAQQLDCKAITFDLGEVKRIEVGDNYLQTWKCDEVGNVWHMDTEDMTDWEE